MAGLTTDDAQELARLRLIVARVERVREAMKQVARESVDHIQHVAWTNAESFLADALNGTGPFGACEPEPTSRYWAVWSETEPPRLLDLIQFDDRPRTEAEVRAGFDEDTAPDQPARLEAISKQRHAELETTYRKESRRG
jgi:hypothetical protein